MKKYLSIIMVFVLLVASVPTFASDTSDGLEIINTEETLLISGIEKIITTYNDGEVVVLYKETVTPTKINIYNHEYEIIAVIESELVNTETSENINMLSEENIVQPLGVMGSWFSLDSYYNESEYVYVDTYEGSIKFPTAISLITIHTMGSIINVAIPFLGNAFSVLVTTSSLFALYGDSTALYFTKKIYNHQHLGSLEQMYHNKMYFDSARTKQSGSGYLVNYKHFA